jgi:hypothetical protein
MATVWGANVGPAPSKFKEVGLAISVWPDNAPTNKNAAETTKTAALRLQLWLMARNLTFFG